jgi:hypothetical protein
VTNQYRKNDKGILYPVGGDPLPAFCTRRGNANVVMLSGFPGRPAVPARPAEFARDPRIGWDSGANSLDAFDGDCRTVFGVRQQTAIACGFAAPDRVNNGDWRTIRYGFYFDRRGDGAAQWSVVESGRVVVAPRIADPEDQFTVQRIAGTVSYLVNGSPVHASTNLSSGPLIVASALYQGGDAIY